MTTGWRWPSCSIRRAEFRKFWFSLEGWETLRDARRFMKGSKKKRRSSFTTRQGVLLSLSIGAFVALMFVLVYYVYILPMQKSLE
jgi:hypothetical protein